MSDTWTSRRRTSPLIASPAEDEKMIRSRNIIQEGVQAGAKAAAIWCVASAVPTLVAVRKIPWAKAYLNCTAQTFIISSATVVAFVITTEKTIHEYSRRDAQERARRNANNNKRV